ncbi:MAG: helix-turn-helix domain-containing protein [Pseudomonadota bacterium]
MEIGEVSRRANMPVSTLRYYEEIGLIKSAGRKGLKRTFSDDVIEKLAFISLGRVSGLSLDEIRKMLQSGSIQIDRELLLKKAEELDAKIAQLKSMRDGLRHAANCPAPSHVECPQFLRLLNIAGKRWSRTKSNARTSGEINL